MDKLIYKQMLAEEASTINELKNEINRLQLLVGKYKDDEQKITKLIYENSNDYSLGSVIRKQYFEKNKKSNIWIQ